MISIHESDLKTDRLKAHVDRLRDFISKGVQWCDDESETINLCSWDARELLNETPEQSLAEIKAAAIEEATEECQDIIWIEDGEGNRHSAYMCESEDLLDYAKQLRK